MPRIVDHDQRRQEVAAAVLRVVVRCGLDGVTMREVASESGWSTGVLTHYFDRKDNLLHGALVEAARQSGLRIRQIRNGGYGPVETLRRLLEEFLPLDERRIAVSQVFTYFYGQGVLDPRTSAELSSYYATMRRVIRECMEEGRADGSMRADLDVGLSSELVVAITDGLGLEGTIDPKTLPPRRQREHIRALMATFMAVPQAQERPRVASNGARTKRRAVSALSK